MTMKQLPLLSPTPHERTAQLKEEANTFAFVPSILSSYLFCMLNPYAYYSKSIHELLYIQGC